MFLFTRLARRIVTTVALSSMAAATLTVGSTSALAQQDEATLDEIIVTSRYREERLQETPIAVTAITAADIEVRGLTDAYQVGYVVPNASLRPAQAAFGNTMTAFIRGIGQYDFNFAFEPGVGIYFDDVLYPVTMGSMIDLMDLERIEVLRGPQGTLFGRGSLGGSIRYVSRQPRGDDTGEIRLTTGSYDRMDIRASYDFGISDTVSARVTGVSKRRDGHQNVYDYACLNPGETDLPQEIFNRGAGCKVGTQGGEDISGGRGILRIAPSDDLEFLLTADTMNDNSEARADTLVALATQAVGNSALPIPFNFWENGQFATYGVRLSNFLPPNIYTSYATYSDPDFGIRFPPKTSLSQTGYSGKMTWGLNQDMQLEAIASYREFDGIFATDADQGPLGEQTVDGRQAAKIFTGELRLSGRMMDRLDWTVGYFHYDGEFDSTQQVSIPAFVPAPFLVNGATFSDATNDSFFAHGVYDLSDQLSITAGVRYSDDSKGADFDNSIVVATNSFSDTSFDWKVGLDYQLSDDVLIYGSAATGYRPQAFNPRPFQVTQFVPVDGEEAVSYDVGIKSDLAGDKLRLNVAAFYIDYKKRILPVGGTECLLVPGSDPPQYNLAPPGTQPGDPDPNDPNVPPRTARQDSLGNICFATTSRTFYDNIPATVTGAEVEFVWRPTEALTVSGIFGYTDFQGDEFDDPTLVLPPGVGYISDRPTYVPEQNWNLSASYVFPLANGSTLTPRVDIYGQSEICPSQTFTNSNPTITDADRCTASFELVNVALLWTSPNDDWMITVGGTNVTDEEYFLNKFDLTGFGQPTIEGQPGRPNEWFVTFQRNFQ